MPFFIAALLCGINVWEQSHAFFVMIKKQKEFYRLVVCIQINNGKKVMESAFIISILVSTFFPLLLMGAEDPSSESMTIINSTQFPITMQVVADGDQAFWYSNESERWFSGIRKITCETPPEVIERGSSKKFLMTTVLRDIGNLKDATVYLRIMIKKSSDDKSNNAMQTVIFKDPFSVDKRRFIVISYYTLPDLTGPYLEIAHTDYATHGR